MNIRFGNVGRGRRPAALDALRAEVRRIERGGHAATSAPVVPLGIPALDAALPEGGIARGRLHEIAAGDAIGAAAAGFAALLLARFAGRTGWAAWCRRSQPHGKRLHPQGLAVFGLAPERLVVVRAGDSTAALWAAEECLRSGTLAATLIEAAAPAPAALRRLQLAAEQGGGGAFLLRPAGAALLPATALTAWRIAAASGEDGTPRWRIELVRARGGMPGTWLAEWRGPEENGNDEAGGLALVADLRHRLGEAADERDIARRAAG